MSQSASWAMGGMYLRQWYPRKFRMPGDRKFRMPGDRRQPFRCLGGDDRRQPFRCLGGDETGLEGATAETGLEGATGERESGRAAPAEAEDLGGAKMRLADLEAALQQRGEALTAFRETTPVEAIRPWGGITVEVSVSDSETMEASVSDSETMSIRLDVRDILKKI